MAELRSFIIGIVIAGAVLLVAAVAFGAFSGDSNSPSAVLLSTPPATRTQQPAVTRTAVPSGVTGVNGAVGTTGATGATGTRPTTNANATAVGSDAQPTITPVRSTTPAATSTPAAAKPTNTPVPVSGKTTYINQVNPPLGSFSAQLNYLIGNASAPNLGDANWKTYTTQAAQNVKTLAGQVAAVQGPACLASGRTTLVQGVNQASSAADAVIAAINGANAAGVTAAAATLQAASGSVNQGISAIEGAAC